MKNTCIGLLLSVTIVFLTFCVSVAASSPSSTNSLSQQPSNSSNNPTDQSISGHIASKKETFPSVEQWLSACVAEASQVNQELVVYNKGLSSQLIDTKKEIETVKRKYKDSEVRRVNLKEKQEELDRILAWSKIKLETARKELEAQQHVVAEATKSQKNDYAAKLKGEVKTLKANITEMEKRSRAFASLSTSINAQPPTKKRTN